ncbi:hypothetical protein SAMN05443550_101158 [Pedobacter hartonius]|uniref:Uncharacterized protein n=1 Tax=Pedobacter hartonius TaxID=425514 RepID=A0A1H3W9Z3_9SPHI|nr:hypothetical protein SAMN05443550_101158 [Pedobacter hartonius]
MLLLCSIDYFLLFIKTNFFNIVQRVLVLLLINNCVMKMVPEANGLTVPLKACSFD